MRFLLNEALFRLCVCLCQASNAYCLASTVSSRLLQAIASKEGVNYVVSRLPTSDRLRLLFNTSFCPNTLSYSRLPNAVAISSVIGKFFSS